MSDPTTKASTDKQSLETYYGRRLKEVAAIGTRAGKWSLGGMLKGLWQSNEPCTKLAVIQSPQESAIVEPTAMLPLLSGFSKPYALEIYKGRDEQIQFQIAFNEDDTDSIANLRALFGSHLNIDIINIEAWSITSGLNENSFLSYLLPTSSLYPLSFAIKWKEADVVGLLLEKLKTYPGTCLVQIQVHPLKNSGQEISTDVLAALNYMNRVVEAFRLGLIKTRFSEPLAMFSLSVLADNEETTEAISRSMTVLNAPFNSFRKVKLSERKSESVAQAVLERKQALTDGLSIISLPELAGLWHLDLQPDFNINRAKVREVATARIDRQNESGRILGYHTLRGKTYPVVLPYKNRNNHSCVFGKSQSGKSTALIRIATQDIEAGLGVAFIDQHDLPLRILPHIPKHRWDDVILISPRLLQSGKMFPLNLFNLGHENNAFQVEFVCETLKEILSRAFGAESIGPRTSYILDIATTALLKDRYNKHSVLDLAHVLLDQKYRFKLADGMNDEDIKEKLLGFDKLPKDSFAAPLNKLQLFSRDSIRPMLATTENGFNTFRQNHKSLLDAKPIIICDLADIPHASAVAIGSIVLALLQLEAFKRNPQEDNTLFNCYVDEAAAFLNMENSDLITRTFQECAKFRMSLSLINQSYDTIPQTVRKTLSTNVASLMYFAMGIGSGDAKIARAELHNEFTEEELNALPVGRAAVRINGNVFSINSPDFKTPQNPHTEELIEYALQKHCTARHRTSKGDEATTPYQTKTMIPQSAKVTSHKTLIPHNETTNTAQYKVEKNTEVKTPHNAHGTNTAEQKPTVEPNVQKPDTAESKQAVISKNLNRTLTANRKTDLSKLQGQTKQKAILKMLRLSGLIPLSDLNEIFFPDSPAYGRQFLKKMANEKQVRFIKLGKRVAYYPNIKGGKNNKQSDIASFTLPDERLWEHAAMTGSIGARLCSLAAKRGAKISVELESNWQAGANEMRPDLTVSWDEGARSHLLFIEADRATESVATFRKDKLDAYNTTLVELQKKSNNIVRLTIVVPDTKRMEQLKAAAIEYPQLAELIRLTTLDEWKIKTDIFKEKIFHRTLNNELVSV